MSTGQIIDTDETDIQHRIKPKQANQVVSYIFYMFYKLKVIKIASAVLILFVCMYKNVR